MVNTTSVAENAEKEQQQQQPQQQEQQQPEQQTSEQTKSTEKASNETNDNKTEVAAEKQTVAAPTPAVNVWQVRKTAAGNGTEATSEQKGAASSTGKSLIKKI